MKTLVVAIDESGAAKEALRYTFDLASQLGATVHAVHVAPETEWAPIQAPAPPVRVPHTPDAYDRRPLEEAAELAELHHVPLKTELFVGDPVDEIVAYADSVDADLIVLGSRGRGAIAGAVLGSVSLGVLHEAMRPVLILHEQGRQQQPAATPGSEKERTAPRASRR